MKKQNKRKVFAIAEPLIVIAIIAILASVLIPVCGNMISKEQNSTEQDSSEQDNKALQEAKNAYNEYLIEQNGADTECMAF